MTLAASAVATLLAACGGGGGGGDNDTPAPADPTPTVTSSSLQVSGTAATGKAFAGARVEVKCATGTATAPTAPDGTYTVTIADGALPCMLEAKTAVDNRTLHSLVASGDVSVADGERRTIARANITPVTEMVVAQLRAALPEQSFQAFPGEAVTPQQVQDAVATIVAALRDAGVDLGSIDPLKGDLFAAFLTVPGNAHDQVLDALAAKVDAEALKVVVNQVAIAAQAKSAADLKTAMLAVSGGSLAGCSVAVSGTYRTVDLFGTTKTHSIDFANMRLATQGTTDTMTLVADPVNACALTATGKYNGLDTRLKVVFGASGMATFSLKSIQPVWNTLGYVFPAQSHAYAALRGTWSTIETNQGERTHVAGQATLGDAGAVSTCTYDDNWACVPDASLTATERSDGGISMALSATEAMTVYAYRAPNGTFVLYGGDEPTANVAGTPISIIATKLSPLPLPSVASAVTSWDAGFTVSPSSAVTVTDPAPITYATLEVNAAAGTSTRQNTETGRVETLRFNTPLPGVRTRDAGDTFAKLVQVPLPGLGITMSLNAEPWGPNTNFIHNIAIVKP